MTLIIRTVFIFAVLQAVCGQPQPDVSQWFHPVVFFNKCFYHAMLCIAWTMLSQNVWLSVRQSHAAGTVSKWLNTSSKLFHYQVATTFYTVSQKTCDYIFDDKLIVRLEQFWHTYYQEYRPLTDVFFIFPPYLFHSPTLP